MIVNYEKFCYLSNLLTEGWMGEIWKRGMSEEEIERYDEFNKKLNLFYKMVSYDPDFRQDFRIRIPSEISNSGIELSGDYYFILWVNRTFLPDKDLYTKKIDTVEIRQKSDDHVLGLLHIINGNYTVIDKKEKIIEEFFTKIKTEPKKAIYMEIEAL